MLETENLEKPDELVVLTVERLRWKTVPDGALSREKIIKKDYLILSHQKGDWSSRAAENNVVIETCKPTYANKVERLKVGLALRCRVYFYTLLDWLTWENQEFICVKHIYEM